MRVVVAAAVCALVLAGCADYAPPPRPQAISLGAGEWRLSASALSESAARLRVLRRAADLTLRQGGDWFRVLDREHGVDGESDDFQSGSTDAGDLLSDPGPVAVATLEIQVGRGDKPTDRDSYDAHAVAASGHGGRSRRARDATGTGSKA